MIHLADFPITNDSCDETPERCECGALLKYEDQVMDEPMCEDCAAIQAQEENE